MAACAIVRRPSDLYNLGGAMSWTDGYVNEVGYTYGYYRDLSPLTLDLALTYQSHVSRPKHKLRYLELGFGQGLSLNMHAAAMDGEFWGTDFNPAHAAHARELAEVSGNGARIFDQSFAEFADRPDLPEFDVIALHGIWSWISDANRQVIVDIIRRKLVPGGVVFMSYNILPGWSATLPLRQLLLLHAELADKSASSMTTRIDNALAFAQILNEHGASYFRVQPAAAEWLKMMSGQDRGYLAHEYFNADWHPMTFADAARQLENSKLSFVASAHMIDHWDLLNLSAEQQNLMNRIEHPVLRETVRDYCMNRQFRRDVWVKGPRRLTNFQQAETLKATRFILIVRPEDVPYKAQGAVAEANLTPELYRPVIEVLAKNAYAPKTAGEIAAALPDMSFQQVVQALVMFTGLGHVSTTQSDEQALAAKTKTDALNDHLILRAVLGETVPFLTSPLTGGGILVQRFEQLFLKSLRQGQTTPEDWAIEAWRALALRGECLIKNGQPVTSGEEIMIEMTVQAREFADKRLPILKALMMI